MNPLVSDAFVDFLLSDVLDAEGLCALPAFSAHGKETIGPWLAACRRVAREVLFPTYRAMDEQPPRFEHGRVTVHPKMHAAWKELVDLGVIAAGRPPEVGGQQLPLTVATLATAYLMAANLSAYGYAGLTTGAAHLVEAFGSPDLKAMCLEKLYSGQWTGTMALTEPQAGSSLADVTSRARPTGAGHFLISGAKSSSRPATTISPRTWCTWCSRASTARPRAPGASRSSRCPGCAPARRASSPTTCRSPG